MSFLGYRRPSPEARFLTRALRGGEPAATSALIAAARKVRDWDRVALLGMRHGVCPWLIRSISHTELMDLIPNHSLGAMRQHARACVLEALSLDRALQQTLLALGEEGIPVAVLKGPAIAERYYPDPSLRPYGDIDLLVPLEAHRMVFDVCDRLGYTVAEDHGGLRAAASGTCESPFETRFVHEETELRLEIHYDHLQIGLRPHGMDGVWRRSEPWRFHGALARVLAPNDLFLFLCVHLNKHGFGRLIWFKDLDLIIRRQGRRLDWQRLAEAAQEEGVRTSLRYALRLLKKLLDLPLPEEASALAKLTGVSILHRLLWREADVLNLDAGRWRRAVQFVPKDGLMGALPSFLVLGRRPDKLRAIGRRLMGEGKGRKPSARG